MNPLLLREILESLNFTSNLDKERHVLIARHASVAHKLFMQSIEYFEEYQRFQTSDKFKYCKYIVSFIGLPGKGAAATFAGVYKVAGRYKRGQSGFRDPVADPERIAKWPHVDFLYDLLRLKEFDFLQLAWDIQWNVPSHDKYQYLKPSLQIPVLRFANCEKIADVEAVVRNQVLDENNS